MPMCILAEPTPTPTPISDERIKVMVKECAVDILNNTLEGADTTKIESLFDAVSVRFGIPLTDINKNYLFSVFIVTVKDISACGTKQEQEDIFKIKFDMLDRWGK